MRVDDLVRFIRSREHHRLVKEGLEKPSKKLWDPIIAQYRFCNVRRNSDRVTKFIFEWAQRWDEEDHLWFAFVVARLFNQPDTLADVAEFTLPFKRKHFTLMLHKRKARGLKNFNAAYIVSTNGRQMDKVSYLVEHVLAPLWDDRKRVSKLINEAATLDEVHKVLMAQNGMASFMAAQVIADLKYFYAPGVWPDFDTFAASGPGSVRGLNYVMDAGPKSTWAESLFRETLLVLRDRVNAKLKWSEPLTAHDIQNCLCEASKWFRTRYGTGKPKQLYKPRANE